MRKLRDQSMLLLLGLALTTGSAVAQERDFSKVEVKATRVAGNVYMLEGAGGNIGVSVGPDGTLIVDDQFAPMADKIRAALQGIGAGPLEFVLNTHWHGDHTGGNATFGKDATIIAHHNVRKRLSSEQTVRGQKTPPSPAEALPVVTYGDEVSIHFNGEEILALHLPKGHTDGDSAIYFTGSKVIHLGDDFFVGKFPFVDMDSGGTVEGLIENVAKILARIPPDIKIIPGHGPLSTREDLKTYFVMLTKTSEIVQQKIKAGKDLAKIQEEGLPAEWAEWGTGFIKTNEWLETLYKSFQGNDAHGHHHGGAAHQHHH